MVDGETQFEWREQPDATEIVAELLTGATVASERADQLALAVGEASGARLADWVDHVGGPVEESRLASAGFVDGLGGASGVWRHPAARLPAVVPGSTRRLVLRVDDVTDFAMANGGDAAIEGVAYSGYRQAILPNSDGVVLGGAERRSWRSGIEPTELSDAELARAVRAFELWAARRRADDGPSGLAKVRAIATEMVDLVGEDLAASYALELERRAWASRNHAARLQRARQERVGVGLANHDHHTFRSARPSFRELLEIFAILGFQPREHFASGADAGWGAQIVEHPGNDLVIFSDVDLRPDELGLDFYVADLEPLSELGTVGVWCALHGESLFRSGMHHLALNCDFDALSAELGSLGVAQMPPFSTFDYLKQSFTSPEPWRVDASHLGKLVADGSLDGSRNEEFSSVGASGSHVELIERGNGFKGFNQGNVSSIILANDPRSAAARDESS